MRLFFFSLSLSISLASLVQSVVFLEADLDCISILEPFWFAVRSFVKDLG